MSTNVREKIIAGNWKMNITPSAAGALIADIKAKIPSDIKSQVVLCVPYTDIAVAVEQVKASNIKIGAQNCHWEVSGAFTGEISADMLLDLGVEYCILGHSERRQYFGETDESVNKRLSTAINKGLYAILCVGETLKEREGNKTFEVVERQVTMALKGIGAVDKVIVAYEPIWAIGTGKTATSAEAQEVCAAIRKLIEKLYDKSVADSVKILYGGSMNSANAEELLAQPDIDGGLIGGASLKANDFAEIVKFAK